MAAKKKVVKKVAKKVTKKVVKKTTKKTVAKKDAKKRTVGPAEKIGKKDLKSVALISIEEVATEARRLLQNARDQL